MYREGFIDREGVESKSLACLSEWYLPSGPSGVEAGALHGKLVASLDRRKYISREAFERFIASRNRVESERLVGSCAERPDRGFGGQVIGIYDPDEQRRQATPDWAYGDPPE